MLWLQCVQAPQGDYIKYVTDELDNYVTMGYYKFLQFVFENEQIKIVNREKFIHELDSFQTIIVNTISGQWEVIRHELKEYTFEELLKVNENLLEKKEKSFLDKILPNSDLLLKAKKILGLKFQKKNTKHFTNKS